jgi:hypothetical protein
LELVALGAVIMPRQWMAEIHAWLGLGELPTAPIVGFLARSASLLYAVHGLLLCYISFDLARYGKLIRFLGAVAFFQAMVMIGVGLWEGLPLWWTLGDGLAAAATGAAVVVLERRSEMDK